MIHLVLSSTPSFCFRDLLREQRKCCFADRNCLFLAKSSGTIVLKLLIEGVTVTDRGDVIALEIVSRS
jgi:hypothetical protein